MDKLNKIKNLFFTIVLLQFHLLFAIEDPLDFKYTIDRSVYRAGEKVTLSLDIDIDPGWNIYATNPEESLRPTEIEYEDTTLFDLRGIFKEPKKPKSDNKKGEY